MKEIKLKKVQTYDNKYTEIANVDNYGAPGFEFVGVNCTRCGSPDPSAPEKIKKQLAQFCAGRPGLSEIKYNFVETSTDHGPLIKIMITEAPYNILEFTAGELSGAWSYMIEGRQIPPYSEYLSSYGKIIVGSINNFIESFQGYRTHGLEVKSNFKYKICLGMEGAPLQISDYSQIKIELI